MNVVVASATTPPSAALPLEPIAQTNTIITNLLPDLALGDPPLPRRFSHDVSGPLLVNDHLCTLTSTMPLTNALHPLCIIVLPLVAIPLLMLLSSFVLLPAINHHPLSDNSLIVTAMNVADHSMTLPLSSPPLTVVTIPQPPSDPFNQPPTTPTFALLSPHHCRYPQSILS